MTFKHKLPPDLFRYAVILNHLQCEIYRSVLKSIILSFYRSNMLAGQFNHSIQPLSLSYDLAQIRLESHFFTLGPFWPVFFLSIKKSKIQFSLFVPLSRFPTLQHCVSLVCVCRTERAGYNISGEDSGLDEQGRTKIEFDLHTFNLSIKLTKNTLLH